LDPSDIPGKLYFHAKNRLGVRYSARVIPKAKFAKKFLVWQAIDEFGNVSEPFVSEGTMSTKVYLEECIKKRLLPFIDKHHQRENVFFWPDMATCHYALPMTQYLTAQKIDFIKKSENAPNVPQARGIELFWALCKTEYRKRPNKPKNVRGFRQVWKTTSVKVAKKSGKPILRKLDGTCDPLVAVDFKEQKMYKT
jgi:hypothetical protein